MTPKQKAEKLFNKYYAILFCSETDKGEEITVSTLSIKCARVLVLSVMSTATEPDTIRFYGEVLEELERM